MINMKQKIKILTLSLLVAFGCVSLLQFSTAPSASAQLFSGSKKAACEGTQLGNGGGNCLPGQEEKLNNVIKNIINILSIVIGIIAVIMIIINGLRFITSGGDSQKVASARNGIIYALVGLLFVALAQIIVKFVLSTAK